MERTDADKLLAEIGKPFGGIIGKATPEQMATAPSALQALFGVKLEDPRTLRRAKAREAFYSRFYGLLVLALICATILGIVWMIVR